MQRTGSDLQVKMFHVNLIIYEPACMKYLLSIWELTPILVFDKLLLCTGKVIFPLRL